MMAVGIKERITQANSLTELDNLVNLSRTYDFASDRQHRRWNRLAATRRSQLLNSVDARKGGAVRGINVCQTPATILT